jgi:hypothetical protein
MNIGSVKRICLSPMEGVNMQAEMDEIELASGSVYSIGGRMNCKGRVKALGYLVRL